MSEPVPDSEKFSRHVIAEDFRAVVRGEMTMEAFNHTYGNAARVFESDKTQTGCSCVIDSGYLID